MRTLTEAARALREVAQKLGPYLMLELFLPGGTLLAIGLYLYRRRKASGAGAAGALAPAANS